MQVNDQLQFMYKEKVLGAIELKDGHQYMGTVEEIADGQITFYDHSPNELTPVVTVPMDAVAKVWTAQQGAEDWTKH
jgi:hypothetical protein